MASRGYHPNFADTGNVARHHVSASQVKLHGEPVSVRHRVEQVIVMVDRKSISFTDKASALKFAYGKRKVAHSVIVITPSGVRLTIK
jgi:hypothetical protein